MAVVNRIRHPQGLPGFKTWPLIPSGYDKEAHLLPALISLSDARSAASARQSLAKQISNTAPETRSYVEAEPPVLMLMSSDASLEQVQAHLASRLIARLPGLGKALLRWYDPEVFVHLLYLLRHEQLASLFGPVKRIAFHWRGSWLASSAPTTSKSPSWMFDASDTVAFNDVALVNAVAEIRIAQDLSVIRSLSQQARAAIHRARGLYGLTATEDLVAFATQSIVVDPSFDQHPRLQSLMRNTPTLSDGTAEEAQTYADATALIPNSAWAQIKEELNATRSSPK